MIQILIPLTAVAGNSVATAAAPSSSTEMNSNSNSNSNNMFSSATTETTTTTMSTSPTPGAVTFVAAHATRSTDVDEMMAAYNQIEDDFKAAVIACRQISSSSTAAATTGSGKSKTSKKDVALS
jgi:gas vesicle protein